MEGTDVHPAGASLKVWSHQQGDAACTSARCSRGGPSSGLWTEGVGWGKEPGSSEQQSNAGSVTTQGCRVCMQLGRWVSGARAEDKKDRGGVNTETVGVSALLEDRAQIPRRQPVPRQGEAHGVEHRGLSPSHSAPCSCVLSDQAVPILRGS